MQNVELADAEVELVFYQFPVVAPEGEELVVCALFADLAIFDEYDAVSIHHGAEAVSSDNDGFPSPDVADVVGDGPFVVGIER